VCVCVFSVFFMFFMLFSFVDSPSVLWYCWLGLLTWKNRLPYNLYCVGGDVKHCSLTGDRRQTTHVARPSFQYQSSLHSPRPSALSLSFPRLLTLSVQRSRDVRMILRYINFCYQCHRQSYKIKCIVHYGRLNWCRWVIPSKRHYDVSTNHHQYL